MKNLLLFALFIILISSCSTSKYKPLKGAAPLEIADIDFQLQLLPMFSEQELVLEKEYRLKESELTIDLLKFYISHIELIKDGEIVWKEAESYRLIDIADSSTLKINLNIPNTLSFEMVQFQLGIDSLTHEEGVMGGDLDPIKGMYWAWNTGYINFKIEGFSPISTARDKSFQYHLGGYMQPFETVQTIRLGIPKMGKNILRMDVSKFLEKVDFVSEPRAMSPGAKAKKLSKIISTIFYFDEQK